MPGFRDCWGGRTAYQMPILHQHLMAAGRPSRFDERMRLEPGISRWIEAVALPRRRIIAAQPLTGGYSNENIQIIVDGGESFVLRRYRRFNACAVETALAWRVGTVVPVPTIVAADPDGRSAGESVLLMTFMPGRPMSEVLPKLTPADAAELGRSTGAVLATLGTVTFDSPGFFSGSDLEPGPPGVDPTEGLPEFVERCLKEGNAEGHLTRAEQTALLRYAERAAPPLAVLRGARQLVHADFNPKNILAEQNGGRWWVSAVLDWEFAFSSSPLFDVGNLLRHERAPGFADGFLNGFTEYGGSLPPGWRQLSQALDLYSLADLLNRPPGHRYFGRAVETIRELLAR
jgi:aminoglycoside phosphotransferase (APT) family kinase protein